MRRWFPIAVIAAGCGQHVYINYSAAVGARSLVAALTLHEGNIELGRIFRRVEPCTPGAERARAFTDERLIVFDNRCFEQALLRLDLLDVPETSDPGAAPEEARVAHEERVVRIARP